MSALLRSPCVSITASERCAASAARNAAISLQIGRFHRAPRQRRSAIGMTRSTPVCMRATPAKPSSTTQSILAPGRARAASVTAGHWCTTSPSEDVLTIRNRLLVDKRLVGGAQALGQLSHGGRIRIVSADSTAHFHSTHLNAPQSALSAVLITRNAANVLEPCLESLGFVDEIVVVDSGSSDGTAAVAARYGARVVQKEWLGFGRQKQFAVEQARNDWVLCLDADERVSAELAASIHTALEAPVSPVYRMARRNRFLGRWLAHGEGYPDWSPRLFNRMNARWSDDLVHEKVLFAVTPGTLQGDLMHDSTDDLTGYLDRQNRYTTLAARQAYELGRRSGMLRLFFSPVVRFFKFYVLRLGFLDGVPGLLHISIGCMNSYMKYAKLLELHKADSR